MGPYEGADCDLQVAAQREGFFGTASMTIESACPLPAFLTDLSLEVRGEVRMAAGWTLWTLSNATSSGPVSLFLVNERGRHR